jgi:serine/threonine protein kinase
MMHTDTIILPLTLHGWSGGLASMSNIGRYEIIRELGRGGTAAVFLARDPYMQREVAIKLLSGALTDDPQFRTRFQHEAAIVAVLDHPYIVPVYDFGYHEEQPFIVMRHMLGGSLAEVIQKQKVLSISESAQIIERMGAALDEAHRCGIIHRDFKPHNILMDAQGETFLADFGLFKIANWSSPMSAVYVMGTAAYMSPEQVHGDMEIDRRTDVYAMGVSLFEMLSGRPPYQDENQTKLMMKHVLDPVPDITALLPDLPAAMAAVITRAMAKDPNARYGTAGEFAAAVVSISRGIPSRRARKRWTSNELDSVLGALEDEEENEA